jgi:hypothetical protein
MRATAGETKKAERLGSTLVGSLLHAVGNLPS